MGKQRVVTSTTVAAFNATGRQGQPLLGIEVEFTSIPSDRSPQPTTTRYRMSAGDAEKMRTLLLDVLTIADRLEKNDGTTH